MVNFDAMKKTPRRIIETALKLFNSKGLSQVTLRTIAHEMGISQGNLNYHFKKREDIIESLYFRLVAEIEEGLLGMNDNQVSLHSLFQFSQGLTQLFYKYRFILMDFSQVMRENKKIREHFVVLMDKRANQFDEIFKSLIHSGIIRTEEFENEYVNLYQRIQILGDFWMSSAVIKHGVISNDVANEYGRLITEFIYPYLTDKGKQEWYALSLN